MTHAIDAEGLGKRFGKTTALAGGGLSARAGAGFGLLGPNGAGEKTAGRILTPPPPPHGGRAGGGGAGVQGRRAERAPGGVGGGGGGPGGANHLYLVGRAAGLAPP